MVLFVIVGITSPFQYAILWKVHTGFTTISIERTGQQYLKQFCRRWSHSLRYLTQSWRRWSQLPPLISSAFVSNTFKRFLGATVSLVGKNQFPFFSMQLLWKVNTGFTAIGIERIRQQYLRQSWKTTATIATIGIERICQKYLKRSLRRRLQLPRLVFSAFARNSSNNPGGEAHNAMVMLRYNTWNAIVTK